MTWTPDDATVEKAARAAYREDPIYAGGTTGPISFDDLCETTRQLMFASALLAARDDLVAAERARADALAEALRITITTLGQPHGDCPCDWCAAARGMMVAIVAYEEM